MPVFSNNIASVVRTLRQHHERHTRETSRVQPDFPSRKGVILVIPSGWNITLSKLLTVTLASLLIAGSSLLAGPIDEVRVALNGPVSTSYKEALSALEKENTQDGKQHLYKMKEMLNNVDEIFHTTESGLEGIDPKLKSQWADLYRLEKDVVVITGVLDSEIGKSSYRSSLSELKNRWDKLMNELPKVYAALGEYGKMTLKFQNLCSSCR